MSLSLDLKKIKSSGLYRFVYDKSQIPPAAAEEIRLCVGYSNKGPFNVPVYLDNSGDFETIFGKSSKKLEKKGIFFHRLCKEALYGGEILALNLKPFSTETVEYLSMNMSENPTEKTGTKTVKEIYDTNRFWKLDADKLPGKIGLNQNHKYFSISATDEKSASCSIFIRKAKSTDGYDLTFREWYGSEEYPEYLEPLLDSNMKDYFVDVYIFKGQFTSDLISSTGVLGKYFNEDGTIKDTITNAFGEEIDALGALADDPNSNYITAYCGITLPEFKDQLGSYISIDLQMQADYYAHKLLCKLDDEMIESATSKTVIDEYAKPIQEGTVAAVYYHKEEITPSTDPKTYKYVVDATKQEGKTYKKHDTLPDPTETSDEFVEVKEHTITLSEKPIYLAGYTYTTDVTIASCLSMLSDSGILAGLTNHVDSEWRYLVDTFGATEAEVTDGSAYKVKLAELIKKKDNAFGIINFPAMDVLAKVTAYQTEGKLDIKKLANMSLPSEAAGASWIGYYTQYNISDGTVKSTVPSAGAISCNFMEKYKSRLPYNVVAGPTFGVVSADGLVGPDYNFSRADLDVMEPKGINCLVYQPRYGTYINSNQTAKQTPVSALSKVHIRELVIYLQDEIETLLRGYQWELNTAALRATIKTKADALLENVKGNGGVYEYRCICDETNNTSEIIDNEMVVLDVHIEPGRAAGKMVQRLYIYRTGQISTLGI